MYNVAQGGDWGRGGLSGHAISANALAYRVLRNAVELATTLGHDASTWAASAQTLFDAANAHLWYASNTTFI